MSKTNNLRILVVDDEKAIRSFLRTSLSSYGYKLFEAADGHTALARAVSTHPDLIILDLGLPDLDGLEVLVKIRKRSKIPIIILSVRDDTEEKIAALDQGADDYLTKPFQTAELIARIRAVLRRILPPSADQVLRVKNISMHIDKHQVLLGNKELNLPPTEYQLLKLFLQNAGKVLTHQQILKEIWDKTTEYEGILHLLRVTISNLRNKLETNPDRPEYLITEPGIGYRLRD